MKITFSIVITLSVIIVTFFSCGRSFPERGDEDNDSRVNVIYQESQDIIINPERGLYSYNSFSTQDENILTTKQVQANRSVGRTLLHTLYYLYDFRDKPITPEFLNRIETNMKALREGGAKCVLRFAYSDSEENTPWDAPLDIVLHHITQLKPYLEEYSDVIYTMEAGFVGIWGEWYYTSHFNMNPQTSQEYHLRKSVLEALLNSLPKDRMIAVRTPSYKLNCFNLSYSDTITQAKAFNKSFLSRLGAHNDCFLASSNDVGTFNNAAERQFWENDSKYTVMGGETCGLSSYSSCENAILQMEKYHWSYLNSDYHPGVLSNWMMEGCFDEISRRLGYRFVLTKGIFTQTPVAGEKFNGELIILNKGFASLVNPRKAEIVFESTKNPEEKYTVSLNVDPREWQPERENLIKFTYTLPVSMKGKKFNLYLNLPDPKPTLIHKPEFSIQLANDNVWESNKGYNKLHTITVE
jgi:hypothetical protein